MFASGDQLAFYFEALVRWIMTTSKLSKPNPGFVLRNRAMSPSLFSSLKEKPPLLNAFGRVFMSRY